MYNRDSRLFQDIGEVVMFALGASTGYGTTAAIHYWVSPMLGEFVGVTLFAIVVGMAINLMTQPD